MFHSLSQWSLLVIPTSTGISVPLVPGCSQDSQIATEVHSTQPAIVLHLVGFRGSATVAADLAIISRENLSESGSQSN